MSLQNPHTCRGNLLTCCALALIRRLHRTSHEQNMRRIKEHNLGTEQLGASFPLYLPPRFTRISALARRILQRFVQTIF